MGPDEMLAEIAGRYEQIEAFLGKIRVKHGKLALAIQGKDGEVFWNAQHDLFSSQNRTMMQQHMLDALRAHTVDPGNIMMVLAALLSVRELLDSVILNSNSLCDAITRDWRISARYAAVQLPYAESVMHS